MSREWHDQSIKRSPKGLVVVLVPGQVFHQTMETRILSAYEKRIIANTGCSEDEVIFVEEVMRRDVLHSTLDWLTAGEFRSAARAAFTAYKQLKAQRIVS